MRLEFVRHDARIRSRKVVIVDIDGTIADETIMTEAWRDGRVPSTCEQQTLCANSPALHDVIAIINSIAKCSGADVHILTARTTDNAIATMLWLHECELDCIAGMHMRENESVSPVDYKERVILEYSQEDVVCIFENDDACCEMYAKHGYRTFKVMEVL